MKTLKEIIIGSAIFLAIDRVARVISNKVVSEGEPQKFSLNIELLILVFVILIAWRVF